MELFHCTTPLSIEQINDATKALHGIKLNHKYAQLNMQTSFAMTDWPEIKYWGTPTMYFYQNGKLVSQLIRWPKEGQKQALIDALTEVKLLD